LFTLALLASGVRRRDDPIGIAMGYPASIGLVWHVTDGYRVTDGDLRDELEPAT